MIRVSLFGIPQVTVDNEPIYFPYRKAEALFYYLIVEKHGTRDYLVNLFWGEVDEKNS